MKEVIDAYSDRGVQVYAVCTEFDEEMWKEFIVKQETDSWINVIDLENKSVVDDDTIKKNISEKNDWEKMVQLSQIDLDNISPSEENIRVENALSQFELLKANGYTQEDESFLMNPMAHISALPITISTMAILCVRPPRYAASI